LSIEKLLEIVGDTLPRKEPIGPGSVEEPGH
jgi:hypothetical protein